MTKQEEIREGIAIILESAGASREWTLNILEYLHSQGVVIKVERELPSISWNSDDPLYDIAFCKGMSENLGNMLKSGYGTAVEPLVEVKE